MYNFLKNLDEMANVYLAVNLDMFEDMNLTDTYGWDGQLISAQDAGDGVEILTDELALSINELAKKKDYELTVKKGDIIYAHEAALDYYFILDNFGESEELECYKNTCAAYNFWDGHNWASIVLEGEGIKTDWELITEGDLWIEINEAIKSMEYVGEGHGIKNYESELYNIDESAWEGDFEKYSLTIKA